MSFTPPHWVLLVMAGNTDVKFSFIASCKYYMYVENGVYMEARAGQTEHQNRFFLYFTQR